MIFFVAVEVIVAIPECRTKRFERLESECRIFIWEDTEKNRTLAARNHVIETSPPLTRAIIYAYQIYAVAQLQHSKYSLQ